MTRYLTSKELNFIVLFAPKPHIIPADAEALYMMHRRVSLAIVLVSYS